MLALPTVGDDDWRERDAKRLELAERKQRLAEQREARLAAREHRGPAPGGDDAT